MHVYIHMYICMCTLKQPSRKAEYSLSLKIPLKTLFKTLSPTCGAGSVWDEEEFSIKTRA